MKRGSRGVAYLEIVVMVGVVLTIALVAVKVLGFGRGPAAAHTPVKTVATEQAVASAAATPAPPAAAPPPSLTKILAKIQSRTPLTVDEQRELDRLAAENGQGAALATAMAADATDVAPEPAPATKYKKSKKSSKAEGRSYGDMSTAELVASLKTPGKNDEKSDAFVKASFPNLTAEQQRALSSTIQKKAATQKKDGDGDAEASGALLEYNINRAKRGLPPVETMPVAVPVAVPSQD